MGQSDNSNRPISIFIPSLRGGGAERAMLQLAEGLISKGHRVDLIVASDRGVLKSSIPETVKLISCNCQRTAGAFFPLVKYLRKERPKAFFSTIPHANLIATVATLVSRSGTPLILRESNSPNSESKLTLGRKVVHWLVPYLYPLANGVIAVSEGVARQLRTLERVPGAFNIKVLPTPVVSNKMLEAAGMPLEIVCGNEINAPVILACGRLVPAKGFDILLKAFAIVRSQNRDSRLIILGEGPKRQELESLTNELQLTDAVFFPGFVLNPFPYFKRADVFVLSSRFEGMPNVLLQALALGTAVVSTDCESGPRECLQDGKLGKLVSVDSVDEMAKAIKQTLEERPQIGVGQTIRETYAIDSAAQGYLDFALQSLP